MSVRAYDSKEVSLVVGGVVITGVASGSFITVERAEDDFTEYVGAQGEVAMSETNNKTGEIKVTLDSTSPSNVFLYRQSKKRGKSALVDVTLVDPNEDKNIRWTSPEARIRRPANYETSNEIVENEWVFFCSELDFNVED